MKTNDNIIALLNCIQTFESLEKVQSMHAKRQILKNAKLPPDTNLDEILVNKSKTRYYTIIDGVIML